MSEKKSSHRRKYSRTEEQEERNHYFFSNSKKKPLVTSTTGQWMILFRNEWNSGGKIHVKLGTPDIKIFILVYCAPLKNSIIEHHFDQEKNNIRNTWKCWITKCLLILLAAFCMTGSWLIIPTKLLAVLMIILLIGSDLAKNIPNNQDSFIDFLKQPNPNSFFLTFGWKRYNIHC